MQVRRRQHSSPKNPENSKNPKNIHSGEFNTERKEKHDRESLREEGNSLQ